MPKHPHTFERSRMLLGEAAMEKLSASRVAVFGLGGVGGYAAEMLARAGVGTLRLVDKDVVSQSNLNRQIIALTGTIGQPKAALMAQRIGQINPDCQTIPQEEFITAETDFSFLCGYDFVVDAIDTVSAKLALAQYCTENHIPFIAAMGCGNRLDPSALFVGDLFETAGCPLGRVMRRELRKRNITSLTVVASTEPAMAPSPAKDDAGNPSGRQTPGSVPFVPAAAGILLAHFAVSRLCKTV